MKRLFPQLGFGLLLTGAASPLLAQVTDTTRTTTIQPATLPVAAPTPAPVPAPVVTVPPAPAPARIDVTDAKAPLQAPVYVPLDQDVYRLIDRYAIKYGPDSVGDIHTSTRPYNRAAVGRLGRRLLRAGMVAPVTDDNIVLGPNRVNVTTLSGVDAFNAEYLLSDNWQTLPANLQPINQSRRPILKHFYRTSTDLYSVNTPDFQLRVNPVLNLQVGSGSDGFLYTNTRGAQIEGTIDKRLGFYTYFTDTQMRVPEYVAGRVRRDNAVPHEGYWKLFKNQQNQFDFLTARGYVTYAATRHINVQLGHDRNVIGNGYRSLILSDYAAPYFFLKLNTRVWKLNYQNLFAELTTERTRDRGTGGNIDTVFQKKYMALHHLSYDITPGLNVGLFESTMFGRGKGRFELQYLNPIIFYRSVEQAVGSNDNAILGADFKWNIKRRAQLYGQVVLDELVVSQVRSGRGWWANKQAFQVGGKYLDVFGLSNLDLQVEYNFIRPYTYQHLDLYRAYEHYGQPLAHPIGANLWELFGQLSYQPLPRLTLVGKGFYSVYGQDVLVTDTNGISTLLNYGGNVLRPYVPHPNDYGNTVAQGRRVEQLFADFTATWMARPNLWLDAKLVARSALADGTRTTGVYPSLALRWNAAQRVHEF
ncbi:capsule assembly Wzi family protein [Hymenobacter jeollabukensis]|uniref:Capsule assembly Wzi family protein n=1 Tax=Hymenobacter jeollabukensis TaxID=2025313 RepID=A0A5R8WVS6_9BACT|nr:capsule assembly Wzi family protein [Hymenobacter jeollabukensis]TLM95603.1 capsule assembly Wzi family protein [Hymenobacter jeollabukensis]